MIQTMMFVKSPGKKGQAPHQDEYYIPTRDRSLCGFWLALDKVDVENGCLQVLPGSHRTGIMYPTKDHNLDIYDKGPTVYDYQDTFSDDNWIPVELQPGDAIFFNGYLIHKSTPNLSKDRYRRCFTNHYMSAESLLPWSNDGRFDIKGEQDLADYVMVCGKDPYIKYRKIQNILQPFIRTQDGHLDMNKKGLKWKPTHDINENNK